MIGNATRLHHEHPVIHATMIRCCCLLRILTLTRRKERWCIPFKQLHLIPQQPRLIHFSMGTSALLLTLSVLVMIVVCRIDAMVAVLWIEGERGLCGGAWCGEIGE